ncbi:DUF2514 family protein [Pseudomonas sp. Irchel s3b6]|uniref:DUF2514 family protein n=1 Tax=Pseudomonas sp. Irchel s3b6 TaxID=2009078 RepID=UPI00211531A7|nr:DUF2514 family protein [Pseudomonas sp. Irchel s3b6]
MAGVLFGACHHGLSVKGLEWPAWWSDRDPKGAERNKEQPRQLSMNKVSQGGQKIIDQVVADAVAARAAAGSLGTPTDDLARRLSASQGSGHSCTAAANQAATHAVLVFADVFKR